MKKILNFLYIKCGFNKRMTMMDDPINEWIPFNPYKIKSFIEMTCSLNNNL